jgi:hypothetical protein
MTDAARMPNYPTIAHDDRCELSLDRGEAGRRCHCAVRETTWVMTEARELMATMPQSDANHPCGFTQQEIDAGCYAFSIRLIAWNVRRQVYMDRKRALLAYIEATQ